MLLLDEPTNHLDVRAQLDTLAVVRDLTVDGVTVVAALHDLNLAAARCDHVVLLHQGRVVAAGGRRGAAARGARAGLRGAVHGAGAPRQQPAGARVRPLCR